MKPYYKLVFGTDSGSKATVNVRGAGTIPDEALPSVIKLSMTDIISGRAIKTKDDSNLISYHKAFYCTTVNQVFNIED